MIKEEHIEDEDDVLIENFNFALLLSLGILSLSASVIVFVYSAATAVLGQQLPMDFLGRLVFAAVLFVTGLGSLQVFRKRRESRNKKRSTIFFKKRR